MFMLADAAAAFNGKLYIHGGGIGRIDAPVIPWAQPSMALVARFLLKEEELGKPRRLGIRLLDPDGAHAMPPADAEGALERPGEVVEGEEFHLQLVLTVGPVLFAREGIFRFELRVDGKTAREIPLPVVAPHD